MWDEEKRRIIRISTGTFSCCCSLCCADEEVEKGKEERRGGFVCDFLPIQPGCEE